MAYTAANFRNITPANSNSGTLWMYREAGAAIGDIDEDGYFNNGIKMGLADGDIIMIMGSDGFGFYECTVSAGVVTLDANESIVSS
jgi:hypothetical protein